jgi:hypothetical protein
MGHLKRIWKYVFRVADIVQKISLPEISGNLLIY